MSGAILRVPPRVSAHLHHRVPTANISANPPTADRLRNTRCIVPRPKHGFLIPTSRQRLVIPIVPRSGHTLHKAATPATVTHLHLHRLSSLCRLDVGLKSPPVASRLLCCYTVPIQISTSPLFPSFYGRAALQILLLKSSERCEVLR